MAKSKNNEQLHTKPIEILDTQSHQSIHSENEYIPLVVIILSSQ